MTRAWNRAWAYLCGGGLLRQDQGKYTKAKEAMVSNKVVKELAAAKADAAAAAAEAATLKEQVASLETALLEARSQASLPLSLGSLWNNDAKLVTSCCFYYLHEEQDAFLHSCPAVCLWKRSPVCMCACPCVCLLCNPAHVHADLVLVLHARMMYGQAHIYLRFAYTCIWQCACSPSISSFPEEIDICFLL